MNRQSVEKQILHWNIKSLQDIVQLTSLINRKEEEKPAHSRDYLLRDFYFNPSLHLFKSPTQLTFIKHSAELLKEIASFNQLAYLQSLSFQNQLLKHKYWNKLTSLRAKNENEQQAKDSMNNIVWTFRLFPVALFLFGTTVLYKLYGLHQISMRKQLVGLIAAAFVGDFFIRAKKSSDIFYLLPKLKDQKLEYERQSIMNKSMVLDGKINQIEFQPGFVDELIEEADKQTNPVQRKLILEAAGYTVVDNVDFNYQ